MTKNVRIVCTPWGHPENLIQIRQWLYPERYNSEPFELGAEQEANVDEIQSRWKMQRRACDTISAWKLRPPLPHTIESTWLITEAILADGLRPTRPMSNISLFSIKAGYITALTRFVTALLDSTQSSKYKVSMYAKAAELGLPAMFVDLRHEATHGEMPSLSVLRKAAKKALEWLWEDYWWKLGVIERHSQGAEGVNGDMHKSDMELDHEEAGKGSDGMGDEDEKDEAEPWGVFEGLWQPRPIGGA